MSNYLPPDPPEAKWTPPEVPAFGSAVDPSRERRARKLDGPPLRGVGGVPSVGAIARPVGGATGGFSQRGHSVTEPERPEKKLKFWHGLLAFFGFLGGMFFVGIAATFALTLVFAVWGGVSLQSGTEVFSRARIMETMPIVMVISFLFSVIPPLVVVWIFAPNRLFENGPLGVGLGKPNWLVSIGGLFSGIILGVVFVAISVLLTPLVTGVPLVPQHYGAQMSNTDMLLNGGVTGAVCLLILAVGIAPWLEEFVFRGILLTSFRGALGIVGSSIVVTLIFVLMHIGEIVRFWPAALGISAMAVVALFFRLGTGSIIPSICVHFGYNLVIAIVSGIALFMAGAFR